MNPAGLRTIEDLASAGRTLVLGGYGVGNVGDEAILEGIIAQMGSANLTVVSRAPALTTREHEVAAVSMLWALPVLVRHQNLLIGGGGLFSTHMGSFGRLIPAFGLLARRLGKKVHLAGVGIDATLPVGVRPLLLRLARDCASISVRDSRSASILAAAGVQADVIPDFASFAPEAPAREARAVLQAAGVSLERPVVGVAVNAVDGARSSDLKDAIAEIIVARPDFDFCFVPMSRHPRYAKQNDLIFAREIQTLAPSLKVIEDCSDPAAVMALFRHFDAAICMRFHSLVFAERAGIPIIALPYAEKCQRWLTERGKQATLPTAAAIGDLVDAFAGARERVA